MDGGMGDARHFPRRCAWQPAARNSAWEQKEGIDWGVWLSFRHNRRGPGFGGQGGVGHERRGAHKARVGGCVVVVEEDEERAVESGRLAAAVVMRWAGCDGAIRLGRLSTEHQTGKRLGCSRHK